MPGGSLFDLVSLRELEDARPRGGSPRLNADSLYSRLQCSGTLAAHTGCVNALDWSEDGSLLASGSDDRCVALWAWGRQERLLLRHDTLHTANIFSLKFLPTRIDRIVTAAGDHSVKCFQIRDDGRLALLQEWANFEDRAKKVDTEPLNPNWCMAVGEDGSIREYDLRESAMTERIFQEWPGEGLSLNALSVSPLRPHWVAVCGTGPITRLFDRRRWGGAVGERSVAGGQRAWIHGRRSAEMTTSVKFSAHSMDLASSVIGDKIYVLNYGQALEGRLGRTRSSFLHAEEERYGRLRDRLAAGALENYAKECLRAIAEHRSLQYALLPILKRILAYEMYNLILASLRRDDRDTAADVARELLDLYKYRGGPSEDGEVAMFHRLAFLALQEEDLVDEHLVEYHDTSLDPAELSTLNYVDVVETDAWARLCREEMVCTAAGRSFKGHMNRQTVKDVNFVGPHHEYVISGSDGGVFFIWSRDSGSLLFIGRGDSMVVNCIVENPRLPIIASAGIDSDIKLWEPSDAPVAPGAQWFPIPRERWGETISSIKRASPISSNVIAIPCHVQ